MYRCCEKAWGRKSTSRSIFTLPIATGERLVAAHGVREPVEQSVVCVDSEDALEENPAQNVA